MYERSRVNVKVERGSTFTYTRNLPRKIHKCTHGKITQQWKANLNAGTSLRSEGGVVVGGIEKWVY